MALLVGSGCGAVSDQTGDQASDDRAIRVLQHIAENGYSIELISQGDRFSFRTLPPEGEEADDLIWFVGDGTDVLTGELDSATPGPENEFRLYEDMARHEEEDIAHFRVPDQDEVRALTWSPEPCRRTGEGTYGGRQADRYECAGSSGEWGVDPATVWVDQEFRIPLNPWGVIGAVEVDADYDVPAGTFDLSTPAGADVRIIRAPLRKGDPLPELNGLIWLTEGGHAEGEVRLSEYAGAPLVIAVIPREVFLGAARPPEWQLRAFQALSRLTQGGTAPQVLALTADSDIPWYDGFVRRGIDLPVATRLDHDPYRILEELGWDDNSGEEPMLVVVQADGTIASVLQGKGVTEGAVAQALESLV